MNTSQKHLLQASIIGVLLLGLSACKGDESPSTAQMPAENSTPHSAPVISESVSGMSEEALREAANAAMQAQRLYAPPGDNAMEYYLALRDKTTAQAAVSSALTDLMPYALMATEQAIQRDELTEASRLLRLIERTDANAPGLARLKQLLSEAQNKAAQRQAQALQQEQRPQQPDTSAQQQLQQQQQRDRQLREQAEAEALLALEQQRAEEEQRLRQEAEARAEQMRAAEQAQREEQRLRQEAEARAAAARAEEERLAAAAQERAAARRQLVAISTPAPRYPADALRTGERGEVTVELTVGTSGTVTSVRVIESNPPRLFDRETLNAVRRWRFEPLDTPVTTRRTISFDPAR